MSKYVFVKSHEFDRDVLSTMDTMRGPRSITIQDKHYNKMSQPVCDTYVTLYDDMIDVKLPTNHVKTVGGQRVEVNNVGTRFGKRAVKTYELNFFGGGLFTVYEDGVAELVQYGSGVPIVGGYVGNLKSC